MPSDEQNTQLDEVRALISELDQNVRQLKRLVALDKEEGDRNQEDPEALLQDM